MALVREAELPCRRLFLDYHGLKLIHSWMVDNTIVDQSTDLKFRHDLLRTLEALPVKNKTMLHDSKVLSTVQRWSKITEYLSIAAIKNGNKLTPISDETSPCDSGSATPLSNDGTSSPKIEESQLLVPLATSTEAPKANSSSATSPTPSTSTTESTAKPSTDMLDAIPHILEQSSALKGVGLDMLKRIIDTNEKNSQIIEDSMSNEKLPDGEIGQLIRDIRLLASKLVTSWEQLPESFKIPKKLRIEQMKEHEREADQSYKETVSDESSQKTSTSTKERSGDRSRDRDRNTNEITSDSSREKDPRFRRFAPPINAISKQKRRQMFEAKVIFFRFPSLFNLFFHCIYMIFNRLHWKMPNERKQLNKSRMKQSVHFSNWIHVKLYVKWYHFV